MKRVFLLLSLALIPTFLIAPGAGMAAETREISYTLDLTRPGEGEISVTLEMDSASQPLVLEMEDTYGGGLAAGLSSHVVDERATDASGQPLPVRKEGNTWYIEHQGRVTFSYAVRTEGYVTGSAYLDSLARSEIPWPYFPTLEADLAYLPGYAIFVRPPGAGMLPSLQLDLPQGWERALPWEDQPAGMDELLNNPICAGELTLHEQGPLLLALPTSAPAAAGGGLAEYAGKVQVLLEKSESLLGGLGFSDGRRLLVALLFRGEGDLLMDRYYPSSPFSDAVVIAAPARNDPLTDSTIEATTRGMVSLILSRKLRLDSHTLWLREGSAWYLQGLIPYEAGLWGANLFWDRFNRQYGVYRDARSAFSGSMAEAGTQGYESEAGSAVLTTGGATSCASFDSELRSMQPYSLDLAAFLRNLSEMRSDGGPLSNEDIRTALTSITGRDWSAFFRDFIEGVEEIPPSAFSSLNILEPGGSFIPAEGPDTEATTSQWIIIVIAVLIVFAIPFILEPYTMRPRKPGFLEKQIAKDAEEEE
jgi:hypothetical protein